MGRTARRHRVGRREKVERATTTVRSPISQFCTDIEKDTGIFFRFLFPYAAHVPMMVISLESGCKDPHEVELSAEHGGETWSERFTIKNGMNRLPVGCDAAPETFVTLRFRKAEQFEQVKGVWVSLTCQEQVAAPEPDGRPAIVSLLEREAHGTDSD